MYQTAVRTCRTIILADSTNRIVDSRNFRCRSSPHFLRAQAGTSEQKIYFMSEKKFLSPHLLSHGHTKTIYFSIMLIKSLVGQ